MLIFKDIKSLFGRNTLLMVLFFVVIFSSFETYHVYIRLLFAFLVIILGGIRQYVDKLSLWLLLFSLSYIIGLAINSNIDGKAEYLGYLFCPITFYLFGKKIVSSCNQISELTTFFLLCILLFGLNVFIDTISDLSQGVFISSSRTGEGDDDMMSATLLSATVSLGLVGLSAFWTFAKPFSNLKTWLYVILFFMSILAITHQISRTGLVIGVFCTICVVAYKSRYSILKFSILLALVSVIVWIFPEIDFPSNGEVLEAYVSRQDDLDQSMGTDGGRLYRWGHALGMMIDHPGGWFAEYDYVHNLWLDTQRVAGLIPFIALIIITALCIKNQIHLLSFKDNSFVAITLGLNICMILTSFVEPILQGDSTYVYFMFLLWGMQTQYIQSQTLIDTNE